MPLNQIYRKDPPYNVSFDYIDYSNGTGYDIYYGFSMAGTPGTTTISDVYSGMIHKNGTETTLTTLNTYYLLLDVDFDITFNMPKTIKGDILLQIPYGFHKTSIGIDNFFIKCEGLVYHYDGSTETQIGSTATSEENYGSSIDDEEIFSSITTLKVVAANPVNFAIGEKIRFTIKIYAKCDDNSQTGVGGVGCDPMNRTDKYIDLTGGAGTAPEMQVITTNQPTQLAFHVPFMIDN